jgi:hypothetical protein
LLRSTTFAGIRFNRKQLVEIQQTVNNFLQLTLRKLGHTICEHLNWVTPCGRYRIQACLNALEEVQSAGLFQLPEKQVRKRRRRNRFNGATAQTRNRTSTAH